MSLSRQQKDELVNSGKMKDYVGMTWDEIEKYSPMITEYNAAKTNSNARVASPNVPPGAY